MSSGQILRSDPSAKLAMAMAKEVPVSLGEIMAIIKGSPKPNAALLLVAGKLVLMDREHNARLGGARPLSKRA